MKLSLILALSFLITSCSAPLTTNERIFVSVEKQCPEICKLSRKSWTGYVQANTDMVSCLCGELSK